MELTLDWSWSPRQATALKSEAQYLLYGGAKGGGKSVFLCRWAVLQCAKYKGNKGFLGRFRGVDFNNTTLDTFRRFIDQRIFKINEQKKKIFLPWCDGTIDFGGMDDQQNIAKFNSAEYGFFGLDQAEEIPRDAYGLLCGTLRYKLPDGTEPEYRGRLTANPAECWLKNEFILSPGANTEFIKALPSDNPFLAVDYIAKLKHAFEHRPRLLAAYLEGSWDELSAADLCVQPSWVEDANGFSFYGPIFKRIVVCDPAREGDDENVTYVLEQANRVRIAEEYIEQYTPNTMQTAQRLVATAIRVGANMIAIDADGLGGPIADRIEEILPPDISLLKIKHGSKDNFTPRDEADFVNLRAKIWIEGGRKFFEKKVCLGGDKFLNGQLCWPRIKFAENARQQITPKREIKANYSRSNDRSDCLMDGLYAIERAERLDEKEYRAMTENRQGQGMPMYAEEAESMIFAGGDRVG